MSEAEPARLIPVSGISGQREAEKRATSALLAVLSVVRPFSTSLLAPLGCTRAKTARVETFTEPSYEIGDKVLRPDGLIEVGVGSRKTFQALVEVKTGPAKLEADQINAYVEVARTEDYDCVITISNEIAPSPGVHPTSGLRIRSNSKVSVHHLSWMLIMSEAVKEHAHRGVDDPEQAWILGELIRYLSHPKSGALEFADMGDNWTTVRDSVADGSVHRHSGEAVEICQRWDQLLRVAALRLGTEIGADVMEVIPRAQRQNPRLRNKEFVRSLSVDGTLGGTLRVPSAIADMSVSVDVKAQKVEMSASFAAPDDRTARATVVWLVRQLKHAPGSLLVDTYSKSIRMPATASLEQLREDPKEALSARGQAPVRFQLRQQTPMGVGRRSTRKKGFIDSVIDAVMDFYANALQDLKPFVPRAPAIERPEPAATGDQPVSASRSESPTQDRVMAVGSSEGTGPHAPQA
ncbi:MAG: stress response protein [bacterium]|nr:stress response protein [bacterium]